MNLTECVRQAFSNIRANKLRSFLTMLGIIIGISSVITITTIGTSIKNTIGNTFSSLGGTNLVTVYVEEKDDAEGYEAEMEENDYFSYEEIQEYIHSLGDKISGFSLEKVIGAGSVEGNHSTGKVIVLATTPDWLKMKKLKILSGRDLNERDMEEGRPTALVSDVFVRYALDGEDPIGKRLDIAMMDGSIYHVYVVGVYYYDPKRFGNITSGKSISTMLPVTLSSSMNNGNGLSRGAHEFESFDLVAAMGTDSVKLSKEIKQYFNEGKYADNKYFHVAIWNMESELKEINTMIDFITVAISFIAAISMVVGGVGVMNIMLVSVIERTREIGIRKALGAKNGTIHIQFLTESVVICLMGGLIGILIGIVNGVLIGKAAVMVLSQVEAELMELVDISIAPSVTAIVISVAFSMLTGILFGSYPARRAAKMSPIDALRYE